MVVVLLNPASGAAKSGLASQIVELFQRHHVEVRIHGISTTDQMRDASRSALDSHPDAIVAAGGDGTISTVASAMAGKSTPLGVLPLGTLNHFAKDLRLPLDLESAVRTIAEGHVAQVDVGCVNDRIFVNNSSIGVYPSIIERREWLRQQGRSKWSAFALATLDVLRREDEMSIRLVDDKSRILSRTPFLFIGNNDYQVEGFRLGSRVRLDGGQLFACFAPPVRTRDLPRLLAQAVAGRARREHRLESVSAADLWVDTPLAREVQAACDGELLTLKTPLHYRIWSQALKVLVPAG